MSAIHDLIGQISDPRLRERLRHRPEVTSAEVGDLVDGWYGWEEAL